MITQDNGHDTGSHMFSSCGDAMAISEAKIGQELMETYAARKHAFEKGWSAEALAACGLKMPEKKKTIRSNSPFSDQEMRSMIYAIHSLRREGKKAREAATMVGIAYQTYSRWSGELGISYDGACLRGQHLKREAERFNQDK